MPPLSTQQLIGDSAFTCQLAKLAMQASQSSTNAHRYLNPLTDARILVETTNGPRNRVWRSPEVLLALDAFAERAGRRG